MADETPDVADLIAKDGKLYALVDGQLFPLRPTAESYAAHKAMAKAKGFKSAGDPPPKRQAIAKAATPAPDAPDPKAMAARRRAAEALQELDDARERFAEQGAIREAFGVPPGTPPSGQEYQDGLNKYLDRLAENP